MKTFSFALAALVAPLSLALPTELAERDSTLARVQIDASLFPVLSRYTKFAAASYATFTFDHGVCVSPPFKSKLVRSIQNATSDTQAAIFQDDAAKELILSLPGTASLQDLLTDFDFITLAPTSTNGCTNCQVHSGFYKAWRSIAAQVQTALSELSAQNPGYSTIITGHSLGGALITVAYADLHANGTPVKKAYTLGSPRVGNPAFAAYIDSLSGASDTELGNFIRITHHTDGVPSLPTLQMGYQHPRTEIYELDNATGNQTAQTTYRCFGDEATDCNRATAMGFINQDHLTYTNVNMENDATCHSTD